MSAEVHIDSSEKGIHSFNVFTASVKTELFSSPVYGDRKDNDHFVNTGARSRLCGITETQINMYLHKASLI